MNTVIELHDSTVAEISSRAGTVIVRFVPAYLHKSEGRPGLDCGTGWIQDAQLRFGDALVTRACPDLPCDVTDGELAFGLERRDNEIPVPLEVTAPTELSLKFGSKHTVTVKGRSVRLELLGEAKYVEEFKP